MSAGARFYFSGTECPQGHITKRYTGGGNCYTCLQEISASNKKKEYDKKYYKNNFARISDRGREYHKNNKNRTLRNVKRWAADNKEKTNLYKKNYKHKRRLKESSGVGMRSLREWVESQNKICYWCDVECENDFHIDHYIPLSTGGHHKPDNLRISCPGCNLTKSAKDPYKFANEMGKLF